MPAFIAENGKMHRQSAKGSATDARSMQSNRFESPKRESPKSAMSHILEKNRMPCTHHQIITFPPSSSSPSLFAIIFASCAGPLIYSRVCFTVIRPSRFFVRSTHQQPSLSRSKSYRPIIIDMYSCTAHRWRCSRLYTFYSFSHSRSVSRAPLVLAASLPREEIMYDEKK